MREVITELERVRRRGRIMLVAQRASTIVAWVLGVGLALILADYALRLPELFRLVVLLLAIAAFGHFLWHYLRPAVQFWPRLTDLALRVEKFLPNVAGRLASSVEFASAGVDEANPLAGRSVRDTQARLSGESMLRVMSASRTYRDVAIMALFLAITAGLAFAQPEAAKIGVSRLLLPYGSAKWPARTGVASMMNEVLGGKYVHPRGEVLPLRAEVVKGPPTQRVDAEYRLLVDGEWTPWQRIVLTPQEPVERGIQERLVDTNAEAIELFFRSEDDTTSPQRIELAPPPAIVRATLTVTPPAYAAEFKQPTVAELGPGLDDRAVTDAASLIGSNVELTLECNKPLPVPADDRARLEWLAETLSWEQAPLPQFAADSASPERWTLSWRLDRTQRLDLQLVDEHGLANSAPIVYRIEAVEDHLPSITITQPQGDEAVLATAVVPIAAEARDDVAVKSIGLEAVREVPANDKAQPPPAPADPLWQQASETTAPATNIVRELDLGPLSLKPGDVLSITAVAQDLFGLDGASHEPARSPPRKLRIISDTDLAQTLRQQLSAIRQNAIRIEAVQAELQDDVIDSSIQPGIAKAQATVGQRITTQREALEDVQRSLELNRLNDDQLSALISQASDLLDFAGRASNRAAGEIEKRQAEIKPSQKPGDQPDAGNDAKPSTDESAPKNAQSGNPGSQSGSSAQPAGKPGESQAGQSKPPEGQDDEKPAPAEEKDPDELDLKEPKPQDKPVVEAQQEVREELTDLIKLLDRDEDTWAVQRQIEKLLEEQKRLEQAVNELSPHTLGREVEELTEAERTELDRIAQAQRDLSEQTQQTTEQARKQADQMQQVDPKSASAMRNAADTAAKNELTKQMQSAAKQAAENQLRSAKNSQQAARKTLEQMLKDLQETKRAKAEELQRRLASLIESIERLITIQEGELTALDTAINAPENERTFAGRDQAMIRLTQNTQAVASEARSAGSEAVRIARTLDRAADAQSESVAALRALPIAADTAQTAETHSLELLKEARQLAEELQKTAEEQADRQRREELMEAYRGFAQREAALRGETLELAKADAADRRRLVEARRLSNAQDEIRRQLNELREQTAELTDSPMFSHTHGLIDRWATKVTETMREGDLSIDVTDRQQNIADALGRLVKALEDALKPPEEFAGQNSGGGSGGGGQQKQPLIPPVAELELLRGLQEQVYNQTTDIDRRTDLTEAQSRDRLRELGQEQRDLLELGRKIIESMQQQQPGGPPPNLPQ